MATSRGAPVIVMLALAYPAAMHAAFCSATSQAGAFRHDFGFFAGYSPVNATLIGVETRRRFVLAGFTYSYRCWAWDSVSISYTGMLAPAAILIQPGGHAVYGFAMAPVGFTLDLARRRRVHPFLDAAVGVIASTEPIPERAPDATGLNFLVSLGGGVRWNTGPRNALSVGYKFFHISNAYTTNFNPGVDNNVF